ncbi:sensor histidine kinase [Sphingobium sp. EM0848]|uniref:sensor histidine kinase n=1 Tax=Sphingobium sp. EM0848 TaxID=2743473 RepID=UPI00159C6337|nr:ATP-binding protein [Sphingobium sp. EM0848]
MTAGMAGPASPAERPLPTPTGGRQAVAFCLAALIFCIDTLAGIKVALAVLYVLVLVIAGDRLGRRRLIIWSLGCAALTLLSFTIVHARHPGIDPVLRLIISLGANIITSGLLLHREEMDRRVRQEGQRYENVLNALAVAVWEHDFRPVEAAIAAVRAAGITDLRAYLNAHPDFVAEARAMVRITDVNDRALDLMGVPTKQAFFQRLSDFLPDNDDSFLECILAIDERRDMFQAETQVIAAHGEPIDIIVAFSLSPGKPLDRVPGSILDIRQRKHLEMTVERARFELDEVQRTAAVGAMSASIAHEINQPLAAIQGFASAAARWLDRDPPDIREARDSLAGLNRAVENVYEVMQRVRNLVANARGETAPLNLHALVRDAVTLAGRDAGAHGAKIIFASSAADLIILGDRILLKQLLLNLITNAFQAMEPLPPGDRLVEIDLSLTVTDARVTLRDRGPGLAGSGREKPFEPFFTTKRGGMGLGLSICRSIVELHDGRIALANHPEGGLEVTLTLPAEA